MKEGTLNGKIKIVKSEHFGDSIRRIAKRYNLTLTISEDKRWVYEHITWSLTGNLTILKLFKSTLNEMVYG